MAELLDRDLNVVTTALADSDKGKRRAALGRVQKMVQNATVVGSSTSEAPSQSLEKDQVKAIVRACCRALQDKSESCRELSISILVSLLPSLDADAAMEYVLTSIVSRIGIEGAVAEESEELRRQLLELALQCLAQFPTNTGPYIDFYTVLLSNCLRDPFPDLKKAACKGCITLCNTEPAKVKSSTMNLAKAVKLHCLQHKHSSVRSEAVRALGELIRRGAHEILADSKDEQDNRTTVTFLYILCNDQSETVRLAMVDTLAILLLVIDSRYDQLRRVLPHVLLLLSDESQDVRLAANSLMLKLGKLYQLDNEDNTIDRSKRRINMKDIEWYSDEQYPQMDDFASSCPFPNPGWTNRPILGARHAVAEHVRSFLESVLKDITVLDWMIPFSGVNKRVAALRIVAMITWYVENDVVQYAAQILTTLYKVLQDDNPEIVAHANFCVEILGKFLTPEQFLPFLVAKSAAVAEDGSVSELVVSKADQPQTLEETGDRVEERYGNRMVTKTSITAANGPLVVPTLFSTAANVTKTSVLITLRYFLLGCKATLTQSQAEIVVAALCKLEVSEIDSPPMLKALVRCIAVAFEVLAKRSLVCTTDNPMPPEVRDNVMIQTFDSKLLYALLCLRSCDDKSVVQLADEAIAGASSLLTGTPTGLLDLHFGRILQRKANVMPVDAFESLVLGAKNITTFCEPLVALFVHRLAEVNYNLRVTSELRFFTLLKNLLESARVAFTAQQYEVLLRSIVLEHTIYRPGPTAHLFRKLGLSTLRVMLLPEIRRTLAEALKQSEGALTEKVVQAWLSGIDGDDGEMRLSCIAAAANLCHLNLTEGQSSDVLDHLVLRLDDSSDQLRLNTVKQFEIILRAMDPAQPAASAAGTVSQTFRDSLKAKIVPTTKTFLLHMDDHNESLGIKDSIQAVVTLLGQKINKDIVLQLTSLARAKHVTPRYCDEIIRTLE